MCQHACANGATIRFCSNQLDLKPVIIPAQIVAQKRRRFTKIDYQDIEVAVVVEITKRATTAAVGSGNARSAFFNEFLKVTVPKIAKDNPRCLVRILRKRALNLRVHAARGHEQVGPSIIVEINDPSAPAS